MKNEKIFLLTNLQTISILEFIRHGKFYYPGAKMLKNLIISFIILLGIPNLNFAQNNDIPVKTADRIIDSFIEKCGGSAIEEIYNEIRTGTIVRSTTGKVPFTITCESPDRWHLSQLFAWGDGVNYGTDGSSAWIQDTEGVSDMSEEQFLDLQMILNCGFPQNIRDLFTSFKVYTGIPENTSTYTISAVTAEGVNRALEFDKNSGFLIRIGDIYLEDYRQIDKVKRPFRITLGKLSEVHFPIIMQVDDIIFNSTIVNSVFKYPVIPLKKTEPPLYKHRKRGEVDINILDDYIGVYSREDDVSIVYTITRQDTHLMLERTGWWQKIEIIPESHIDFYIKFLGIDIKFIKDETGKTTHFISTSNNGVFKALRKKSK